MQSLFTDTQITELVQKAQSLNHEDLNSLISTLTRVPIPTPKPLSPSNPPSGTSQFYIARPPRLPGLPDPPADRWGVWDEYRDDHDPGYRVRDLPPSDEDELLTARSGNTSFSAGLLNPSTAPSLSATPIAAPQLRAESPVFGRSDSPPAPTTTQYDIFGDSHDVPTTVTASDTLAMASDTVGTEAIASGTQGTKKDIMTIHLRVEYERGRSGLEAERDHVYQRGEQVGSRYTVMELIGSGAFSTAYSALSCGSPSVLGTSAQSVLSAASEGVLSGASQGVHGSTDVCLKKIKNVKDYMDQGLDEIKILSYLSARARSQETSLNVERVVQLVDSFYYREHLFLVTERLYENLYEYQRYCKEKEVRYFSLGRVQRIASQVTRALGFVHKHGVISCDLKPENILFESYDECLVKLIDFGNACYKSDTNDSSYIQSRCYRAPEVILGLGFDEKVDVWSLGCVLAELFTGYVLFQCERVEAMLARIVGIIGDFPKHMIHRSKLAEKFFINKVDIKDDHHILVPKKTSLWQRLRADDLAFVQFVCDCLQLDPALRPSAEELANHEFLKPGRFSDGL